jgi:hydrogenase-1 operon protein HyaF
MNPLSDIPVQLIPRDDEPTDLPAAPSPQALALLQELQNMLNTLMTKGESNSIDIRSLPMLPGDYEQIKSILGDGEVTATVSAMGPTRIHETRIPGIWWVTHSNANDEVMAEIIEVTPMPEILQTPEVELQHAGGRLGKIIDEFNARPNK